MINATKEMLWSKDRSTQGAEVLLLQEQFEWLEKRGRGADCAERQGRWALWLEA